LKLASVRKIEEKKIVLRCKQDMETSFVQETFQKASSIAPLLKSIPEFFVKEDGTPAYITQGTCQNLFRVMTTLSEYLVTGMSDETQATVHRFFVAPLFHVGSYKSGPGARDALITVVMQVVSFSHVVLQLELDFAHEKDKESKEVEQPDHDTQEDTQEEIDQLTELREQLDECESIVKALLEVSEQEIEKLNDANAGLIKRVKRIIQSKNAKHNVVKERLAGKLRGLEARRVQQMQRRDDDINQLEANLHAAEETITILKWVQQELLKMIPGNLQYGDWNAFVQLVKEQIDKMDK
jgi:hypothetical protein